ncbi:hypothetical protein GT002_36930, partial [Streptomyces sp. SID4917]|nr:hypothetical protein [Streptomyces sp. SID4917]
RRHRCARRRGEVAPRLLLRGARLASPHSTNNLSASAPTFVPCSVQGRTSGVVELQHEDRSHSKQQESAIPSGPGLT